VISLRENRNADAGVECLCRLAAGAPVGYSRQSFYSKQQYLVQQNDDQLLVLDLVAAIGRDIPGLGSNKLYQLLEPSLCGPVYG